MRILHTSDWHLGDRLGWIDRTPEQLLAVDQILSYCEEHRVDVLVVAGDVFENYRGPSLADLIQEVAQRLEPLLRAGMQAVFVAGNHDREYFFGLLDTVQSLVPGAAQQLLFAASPRTVDLADRDGRMSAAFHLAPYPRPEHYLPTGFGPHDLSGEDRQRAVAAAFVAMLQQARASIAPERPCVLATHACVETGVTPRLFRMAPEQDVPIDASALRAWSYVALGHIHRAQEVGNQATVRYSGSPLRLDAGESEDDKSCVLVDLDPAGRVEVSVLPLSCRPVYRVELEGTDDFESLPQFYSDHAEALVYVSLAYRPGVDRPTEAIAQLRRIFPNMYGRQLRMVGDSIPSAAFQPHEQDVRRTVRAYLEERLRDHPGRSQVIALADELVERIEHAPAAS